MLVGHGHGGVFFEGGRLVDGVVVFFVIDVELFMFGEDLVGPLGVEVVLPLADHDGADRSAQGEMFTRVARSVSRSEETARDINQRRDLCFPIGMGKPL